MIEIKVIPAEYEKKESLGYIVKLNNSKVYETRAIILDEHYLLKRGEYSQRGNISFEVFGVEDLENKVNADKRIVDDAREFAKEKLDSLIPKLTDLTNKA